MITTTKIMTHFIKLKLFTISTWESLHLTLTSIHFHYHFQGNRLQVSEYLNTVVLTPHFPHPALHYVTSDYYMKPGHANQ